MNQATLFDTLQHYSTLFYNTYLHWHLNCVSFPFYLNVGILPHGICEIRDFDDVRVKPSTPQEWIYMTVPTVCTLYWAGDLRNAKYCDRVMDLMHQEVIVKNGQATIFSTSRAHPNLWTPIIHSIENIGCIELLYLLLEWRKSMDSNGENTIRHEYRLPFQRVLSFCPSICEPQGKNWKPHEKQSRILFGYSD